MHFAYQIPDPLPLGCYRRPARGRRGRAGPARRTLAKSPIRDGVVARSHFSDAAACLWLEGELVHLEDLVLHDAGMDIRAPTHELTRAHAVLRTRRRIAEAKPDWTLSAAGLAGLRGRAGQGERGHGRGAKKAATGSKNGREATGEDADDAPLDERRGRRHSPSSRPILGSPPPSPRPTPRMPGRSGRSPARAGRARSGIR